ncbi:MULTISPECIES: threonine dehydratase [unclassified Nostoc]|uniref:threonine dehydratase n=1 Tax=unclassified Nostoc TaxID=2593658 RepID=UPI002AD2A405|nr:MULTISPECIES: threonine dehydratase [unclassified Nostoc]MDZ8121650.1 threonine dehydratase [Nostoc sp. CmiVER01]MDZ8228090.1 threonine dehydratase [Nostoc sp. ChiVER01]
MFRLPQTVRNLFIRIQGLFGVLFQSVANFFGSFFGFFGNLFGFNSSGYFVESDQQQAIKQASAKEQIETNQDNTPKISATTRRRSNAKIDDYFLNMARDVKKK